MRHYLFNGQETPEEIRQILLDNCEGVETMSYTKQLTELELQELREAYVSNNLEIARHNDDLKAAKDLHKEAVKPLFAENKEVLKTLKTRHTEVDGKVYRMPNLETGLMEYVNEAGEVVHTRRLKPEEKQTRVFPVSKASNF